MLNDLERAVLRAIRLARPEVAVALDEQLDGVLVASRENTDVGFFTKLQPCRTTTLIEGARSIGNVFAKIQGMQNPMTFVLFIKSGLIDTLEGAAVDESTSDIDFSTVGFQILEPTKRH